MMMMGDMCVCPGWWMMIVMCVSRLVDDDCDVCVQACG